MSASKKRDLECRREIKPERILNIIKHNTCDSEEYNEVSNMPPNDLTLRSNFLFSNSIRKSASLNAIQRISESEEQVFEISQINNKILKNIMNNNVNKTNI